ncbi:carboxymuconolactone decarboxylase family protein [Fictibacillus sp. KIGAM418]|uniref:Carboxymuconolactone decarboxylase family protein n=1 Tax=Fictibacillus marinisediminis TaxID=2878389 RepID=A0A9X1X9P2_9BACL|nr:carboxymuconolactone decarboxylase family protein [Fictibacillus marinisediminis]MCK6255323.1 carboxymuconolactone decarboxylase family protein [Fictibacillus marinisediminis]SFF07086.1 alkylhydroperoxidase AhpD family core domain-containing protein [Bacillus sp. OV194]
MKERIRMEDVEPGALQAMLAVEKYVDRTSIDKKLKELIKIRASQINGCAFCLNMHTKEARELGETEQRIYALNAWRETPYFTPEERAVLALTEAVTLVAESHVPDDVYNDAAQYFDEKQLSEIIMQIVVINSWNRLAVTARKIPE